MYRRTQVVTSLALLLPASLLLRARAAPPRPAAAAGGPAKAEVALPGATLSLWLKVTAMTARLLCKSLRNGSQ